jgi:site-specific DNA recombinase
MRKHLATIYCRISEDREGLRAGVERQREDCVRLCSDRDAQIVAVHEDNDVSAYRGKPRPGYKAAIDTLKAGTANTLVAWHPDRLHRSPRELEDFIDLIEATGAQVWTVMAGEYDLSTATGRQNARIVGAVARGESEHKSDRIRRQKQQAAERGSAHGGTRAFGYTSDSMNLEPEEAKLIREAAGRVIRGTSCRTIAAEWNAAGIKTPRGKAWVPQVIRKVLVSPRIRGVRQHRGEALGKAAWPAIIDEQTGIALKTILLSSDRITNGRVNARKYYLAGFLFCGKCGTRLFSGVTNGKPAFMCKKGQTPTGCGELVVKMAPVDKFVRGIITERLLLAPRALAKARGLNKDSEAAKIDGSELDRLRRRQSELEDMFVAGDITRAQFTRMKSKVEAQQTEIMQQLARRTTSEVLRELPTTRADIEAVWANGGIEEHQALLSAAVDRITVLPAPRRGARFDPSRLEVEFRDWSLAR